MSLFLNHKDLSLVDVNPEKLELAGFQYDTMSELLKTVFRDCSMKCIPLDYGESEMNKSESTCTDRCVAKFMQCYRILGNYAEKVGFNERDLRHFESIKQELRERQGN